jgi:O-antigen ligase
MAVPYPQMKKARSGRKAPSRDHPSPPAEDGSAVPRWLTSIVVAGALLIPVVMSLAGEDTFRYPKELALRAEVIAMVIGLALTWGFGRLRLPRLDFRSKWLVLTALICAWVVLCALVSTNHLVSVAPTMRVIEYASIFVATVLVMRGQASWFAAIIVGPAILNGAVYILQELDLWSPFDISTAVDKHVGRTALIGNPNDVGGYFIAPALVVLALAFSNRRFRFAWTAAGAFLFVATFMTHTVAAIGALAVASFVMFAIWLRSWPKTVAAFLAVIVIAGIPFAAYQPLRDRALLMRNALRQRDFETLSAARTQPFLTAVEMIRDRPLMGVGPGCFAYNFFDYKLRLQKRYSWLFERMTQVNYAEVHNDHLQVTAETGLPGYALFLAALVLLASATWRAPAPPPESGADGGRPAFVRLLALPLAISLFILALAQFPLELVAPTHSYLWAAAAIVAWREP